MRPLVTQIDSGAWKENGGDGGHTKGMEGIGQLIKVPAVQRQKDGSRAR